MSFKISPKLIKEHLDTKIVGQDQAKEVVAINVFLHVMKYQQSLEQLRPIKKSTSLLLGPSGCGKTLIVREASKAIQHITKANLAPVLEVDCTGLTAKGWQGDDLTELFHDHYINACGGDDAAFASTIVFLDEFDKLCMSAVGGGGTDHNKQTQYGLLKAVEGAALYCRDTKKSFDTSKMSFIFAGNFPQIRHARRAKEKPLMGFTGSVPAKKQDMSDLHMQLEEAGMITQLVGRVTSVGELNALTKKDLKDILVNHTIPEVSDVFSYLGYDLNLTNSEINAIVRKAVARNQGVNKEVEGGMGARVLQSLLEEYLQGSFMELEGYLF